MNLIHVNIALKSAPAICFVKVKCVVSPAPFLLYPHYIPKRMMMSPYQIYSKMAGVPPPKNGPIIPYLGGRPAPCAVLRSVMAVLISFFE